MLIYTHNVVTMFIMTAMNCDIQSWAWAAQPYYSI